MKKFLWLYNRARAMSIQELFYRIKKELKYKKNKFKYSKSIRVDNIIKDDINLKCIYNRLDNIFGKLDYSNIILEDYFSIFEEKFELNNKYYWHKGSKGVWNNNKYCHDIDFKNSDNIGDIRYTWELNRHQFMPYIASIYVKTNDKKYLKLLEEAFESWIEDNYFLKGVNWSSSMEIALRSYQWLIVIYILKDIKCDCFKQKVCKSIIASIEYVMDNLSLYSSANNHLILEVSISSIIGYSIEDIYKQNWFKKGYDILAEQIYLQNHEDGINKEQALHYQAFVIDAILQYNFILKKLGKKTIGEDIIYKSLEFIGSLKADKLNFDFGDSDDAKIISFSCDKQNYYKYLLELGSIYYKKRFIEFTNISNEVKFISGINKIGDLRRVGYKKAKLYKEGGYLVINNNNNNLLMDVGELGFGSIAAHGHADALSLIYYDNDNPIIIDSGTYIYNIEAKYRNYFRSTNAHSTLCYKDLNQSEIKGPFLWGKRAEVKILNYEEKDNIIKIKACHDGYKPLIHTRELEYYLNNNRVIIRDYFDDRAKVNFILDNNSELERVSDNVVKIKSNNSFILFKCNLDIIIEDTIISKSFMTKLKSKKLVIDNDFSNNKYSEVVIERETCDEG